MQSRTLLPMHLWLPEILYIQYQTGIVSQINMEPAWDIATGTGVTVAVIDTGVAYEDYQEAGVPIGSGGKTKPGATFAQRPGSELLSQFTRRL